MLLSVAIQGFMLDAKSKYSPATIPGFQSNLRVMLLRFGDVDVSSITDKKLSEYMAWLRTDYKPRRLSDKTGPLSGSAVDNHWKTQRVFWRWCGEVLEIKNPAEKLHRAKFLEPAVTPFTTDEIKKLLEACKFSSVINKPDKKPYRLKLKNAARDTAIILILLDCGLRIGELCRLRIGDVDLETGEIIIQPYRSSSKSRPRVVYMGTNARRSVWKYVAKEQAEKKPDDSLFDLSPSSIRHTLKHIGEKAGVQNVYPHRFRHTAAIVFLRSGGDAFSLMRMMGHSDMEMTRRYLALAQSDDKTAQTRHSPADIMKL